MGGKVDVSRDRALVQNKPPPTDKKTRPPTHTVGQKQTLSAIADEYGITVHELIAANKDIFDASKLGMSEGLWYSSRDIGGGKQDPDYLRPGQELKLPAAKPATREDAGKSSAEAKAPTGQPEAEDRVEPHQQHGSTGESTLTKQDREALSPDNVDSKKGAAKTQPPPEKKKGGVFEMLAKVFSHPLFQGALAILGAIPGIGQVVSGIAGVMSLGVFLVGAMNARDGPSHANWITLGSALLYLAGAFIPGIGAFGGLVGMAQGDMPKKGDRPQGGGPEKKPQSTPTEDTRTEDTREAGRPVTDPLEAGSFDQHMAAAHKLASMDGDPTAFDTWLTSVGRLSGERRRIRSVPAGQRGSEENKRLAELDAFFRQELPQSVAVRELSLAYGTENTAPALAPTAGQLYEIKNGDTIDGLSKTLAGQLQGVSQDQAKTAIVALNRTRSRSPEGADGEARDPIIEPGRRLYVPTAEQVRAVLANKGVAAMAESTGKVLSERLHSLYVILRQEARELDQRLASDPPPENAEELRGQLRRVTAATRWWEVTNAMAVRSALVRTGGPENAGAAQPHSGV